MDSKQVNNTREKFLHKVKPMGYRRPKFNKSQKWITKTGVHRLDDENYLILIENILSNSEAYLYLDQAANVERKSGRSGFGDKPRLEVCYTTNGKPLKYSGVQHPTTAYPEHVLKLMIKAKNRTDSMLAENSIENKFDRISDGIDIVYDDTFPRGGSVAAHKDKMAQYGRIDVFSFGQTRLMRIRRDSDKEIVNVEMPHNSLVIMHGPTFQEKYTHEVPKLHPNEPVGARNSINMRYLLES